MECPTLTLGTETRVNSTHVLHQTKTVYDNMLAEKWRKQDVVLLARKQHLDDECNRIAKTEGAQRALEYGVRAQETVNQMQKRHSEELNSLHERYQQMLNAMIQELEPQDAENENDRRDNTQKTNSQMGV